MQLWQWILDFSKIFINYLTLLLGGHPPRALYTIIKTGNSLYNFVHLYSQTQCKNFDCLSLDVVVKRIFSVKKERLKKKTLTFVKPRGGVHEPAFVKVLQKK